MNPIVTLRELDAIIDNTPGMKRSNSSPFRLETTPLASRTIKTPAAISQIFVRDAAEISAAPKPTIAKCNAVAPRHRILVFENNSFYNIYRQIN